MPDFSLADVIALLEKANSYGVKVTFQQEELFLNLPKGREINPSFLEELRSNKGHLIEYFKKYKETENSVSALTHIGRAGRDAITPIPLSFSQERLWFIDQLEGSVAYHIPTVLRLRGDLQEDALSGALQGIVNRHEVLRTMIREQEGLAYQEVLGAEDWKMDMVHAEMSGIKPPDTTTTTRAHEEETASLSAYIKELVARPFDLSSDYKLRATLIRLIGSATPAEYILVVVLHHIASDGWSGGILVKEFMEYYNSLVKKRTPRLAPLPVQYADYAIWQRNVLPGDRMEEKLSYWKARLQGMEPLQLPTDYRRPEVQSTRGAVVPLRLDRQLTDRLLALCLQEGVTLYMLLLTTFKILLSRYSGQQDICVGSAIAGRQQPEIEGLIGFFVNTLALRSDLSGNPVFRDLLQRVKATMLGAYEHQEVPFEKVVDAVVQHRDMSRSPLLQVMLVLQSSEHFETGKGRLAGLEMLPEPVTQTVSKFDLTFSMAEGLTGLEGVIEYVSDLYKEETIVRLGKYYEQLLRSVVADRNARIGSLSMLPAQEERQLLEEFNATEVAYDQASTVVSLFRENALRHASSVAVVFGEESVSYAELDERSETLSRYLRKWGVREESLVPVCVERSVEMIIGILGILKAGGAYVPVDPEYPRERIGYMLSDAAAKLVLTTRPCRDRLQGHWTGRVVLLDEPREWPKQDIGAADWSQKRGTGEDADSRVNDPSADQLAYVIYTSGSTGRPKGVLIEHKGLANRLLWTQGYFRLTAEDSILQKTTYCFDVSVWELLWPLIAGAKLIFARPGGQMDTGYLKDTIESKGITTVHFVPAMLEIFLMELPANSCKKLRRVLCSGEALKNSQVKLFRDKLPHVALYNLYGPTEASIDVSCRDLSDEPEMEKLIPIGSPVSNTQLYILDKEDQVVPLGGLGELHIGGIQLARGYLNLPQLTDEKFIMRQFSKGPSRRLYKTGDLARWMADGDIEYLGRLDDQVKIHGYRIELEEIGNAIYKSGLVDQAVVLAREDNTGKRRLTGYVVAKGMFDREAILQYLRAKLPEYMVPSLWVQLDSLPLTANGKIDKRSLPDPDLKETSHNHYMAPRNTLEQKLATIWEELLGLQRVGIHDDFFELGGDSIITIQVVSRARRAGYELQARNLFEQHTIARLSAIITSRSTAKIMQEQGVLTGTSGLLPIQQWFFEKRQTADAHFNQSVLVGLDKSIVFETLDKMVRALVEQHDALRFLYKPGNDGFSQSYMPYQNRILATEDLRTAALNELPPLIQKCANRYQRGLDITDGKLIQVVLILTPEEEPRNRLLMVIHHLAVDGVSWRILLEDLEILISAAAAGTAADLGSKGSSFRQWVNALEEYSKSGRLLLQSPYWCGIVQHYQPFPVDKDSKALVTQKDIGHYTIRMSGDNTQALLQETLKVYHTEINDLLLSALVRTLSNWTGSEKVIIGLEGHGREEGLFDNMDISRTVGWFTNLYPVLIESEPGKADGDLIRDVKEQLRQIPDKGMGYGVLKYMNRQKELRGRPPWDILFNYLGQLDNIIRKSEWLSDTKESAGDSISEQYVADEKMSMTSLVEQGELVLNWAYSRIHYEETTIVTLAKNYLANLEELIRHCMEKGKSGSVFTPSDYGLADDVNYKELDDFLKKKVPAKKKIMSF